jgi:hypothetical protein
MNWGRLFLGTIVVAFGTLFLLDSTGVLDAGSVIGDWWPLIIIIAGVITLLANIRHWPGALIMVIIGVTLLLSTLDVADLGDIVVPGVIILVGLLILFGRGLGARTETGDTVSSFNMFSGSEVASHSDGFEGGNISVIFGAAELDLRDATPAAGANLDVFAAFGGVEIRVPTGWQVDIKGFPIFGGFENVTVKEQIPQGSPTLAVNATVLFGGLEIKH